ncbi:putative lipid carrier protein YhbT [Azonexus fungiphilus]|jgi:predicted lipid carrier protein YhbT|uniref:Ubiquinone biosynthesis accessory factor UbiT n=1 Tax=Azonexus fungiphilus TaxID=146940 RepID=A0A495W9Z4_9RHOO|nr:SCP2 sterol-binding domain-containing protein [Azonexus fungiphilus]NHC06576.1 sterol-binding protein [Azonexus fungiphilus]RKT58532.1 putative lipid carrier protein YhbT [Azonexus fungiphilus]
MNPNFTIPRFRLPDFVAGIGQKLPQWPHTLVLVGALNAALKLKLLPESELTVLEDKLFRVRVLDTGGEACYTYRDGLFRPVFRAQREPDLAFAANLSAYLQLLSRQEDPDTLFFNRELEITGDTELGLIVKNMLDAIELPSLSRLPLPGRQ